MITFQPVLSVSVSDSTVTSEFVGHYPDFVGVKDVVSVLVLFPFHYFFSEDVGVNEFTKVNVIGKPFAQFNPELQVRIETQNF